jgi:tetratricopeptide (TPR) repeat protein
MQRGEVVAERFEIERTQGSGGMGTVYRAKDRRSGSPVALKIVPAGKDIPRFAREADVLAELEHPNIVRYVAHGTMDSGAWLAMEWLEGEDLSQRLSREGLSVLESMTLIERAAQALAFAHARGVVHRDVKPSNLFLVGGDVANVKLLDFGIARLGARVTRTGLMVGTPGYVSPEQARGTTTLDGRADVFALGCVLFECLTGRPAWVGEHAVALLTRILLEEAPRPSAARPDVPVWLDDLVLAMLAKDPEERPDAAAVAVDLTELKMRAQEGARVTMRPPGERPSLTVGEQRVVSVVLVSVEAPVSGDMHAETQVDVHPPGWLDALHAAAEAHGARLDALANGALVASLSAQSNKEGGAATDLAARAARCALAFRELAPDVPISLATGRGEVGGDAGELALRALRMTGSGIRIDDVTAGLLGASFDVRGDAGGLQLAGEREHVDRARTLLGKPSPCLGREREIGTLVAIFEECVAEPVAGCVLITGPAGIGKSRVRHELSKRLAGRDIATWIASGDSVRSGSPFGMVAPPIRAEAGLREGEPEDVRRRKLAARVARHVPMGDRKRVAAFLGELVGAHFSIEEEPELDAARRDGIVMGDQIRRAWQDFLDAELRVHPVLFVLEDLHWGDVPSVKLVDLALRNLKDRPILVLALARPEVSELFPDLWRGRGLQQIRLDELTRRASEKLVRAFLGADLEEAKVSKIVERAAGNAFYLEEIVRAQAEGKGDAVPGTVLAMVQSRLEGFDAELRRVLRAASVFGQVFWSGAVQELLGDHGERAKGTFDVQALDELEHREVIERVGEGQFPGEYRFRHAVVREAAYAMLTESDRLLGHRLAAEWLEGAGETDPVTLADHWESGGEKHRAVRWWVRGAQQALEGNDFAAVIDRSDRGERCGASGEELGTLRLLCAESLRWTGDLAKAEELSELAVSAFAPGSDGWFVALANFTESASGLGHMEIVKRASELLVTMPPRTEAHASAVARAAGQASAAGEYALCRRLAQSTIDAAATGVIAPGSGWVHRARAILAAIESDTSAVAEAQRGAAAAFEAAGQLRLACAQRLNAGDSYKELGDYPEAERTLRAAWAEAEWLGLSVIAWYAKHNLASVLGRTGRFEEGLELARAAVVDATKHGHRRGLSFAHVYVASILLFAGKTRAALEAIQHAFPVAGPPVLPLVQAIAARAHVILGEGAKAVELAGAAMKALETLGAVEEGEAIIRLAWAEALEASGDVEGARKAITSARDRLLDRASRIMNADHRAMFLEKVAENARTFALAQVLSGSTG